MNNIMDIIQSNWKRYLVSAAVTFAAGFALSLIADIDKLTLESLADGTLVGVIFAGVRTGVKLVAEAFVAWYNKDK